MTSADRNRCPKAEIGITRQSVFVALAISFLTSLTTLCLTGASANDFDRKAETLFSKRYHFHSWNATDHTVDGEDWSLPP